MKKTVSEVKPDVHTSSWDLIRDGVKKNVLYKKPSRSRSDIAAEVLTENCAKAGKVVPGQMLYFNYFNPRTKEDLQYYDATPCTIYFSVVRTEQGQRVVGFNLHYYPPSVRYRIMKGIYKTFEPQFKKAWSDPSETAFRGFDYQTIVKALESINLGFGVRMYDPQLMTDARVVPTQWLSTALFTEGNFKKETRAQILSYWKNWKPGRKK